MDIYKKLNELNLELPKPPAKGGVYSPCKKFGDNLIYVSGCSATVDGKTVVGRLIEDYTLEEAQEYAKLAMLNVLAVIHAEVGDLNKVRPVKILTFVNSPSDFTMQPQVANGGSQLLAELYGADEVPARSAIGVNVLPGNTPVETEALFEIMA